MPNLIFHFSWPTEISTSPDVIALTDQSASLYETPFGVIMNLIAL